MGYYVESVESDFHLDRENYDAAFKALCELNAHDDLKYGQGYPSNRVKPADSKSVGNPNKWFSWMDWNYDETCRSVTDVLADAGFEIEEDKRGICNLAYPYQKAGQEGVFLGAVAPYVRAGSHTIFEGEDGDRWGYSFDGSRMIECDVSLTLTPLPTYDPAAIADAAKTVAGQSSVSEKSNMTIKL